MKLFRQFAILSAVLCFCCAQVLAAPQEQAADPTLRAGATKGAVPRLVKHVGQVSRPVHVQVTEGETGTPAAAQPARAASSVTFAIYTGQEGGAALWQETQNVALDAEGRYSVLLGAASRDGMPADLFATGEPRWLGVRVNVAGDAEASGEQARVLLVSVPYALRAADAETLGGRAATEFVLREELAGWSGAAASVLPGATDRPRAVGGTQGAVFYTGGTGFLPRVTAVDTPAPGDLTLANSQISDDGTNIRITSDNANFSIGSLTGTGLLNVTLTTPAARNAFNSVLRLENSTPITGTVVSAMNLTGADRGTANHESFQVARFTLLKNVISTGVATNFDAIFATTAFINASAPYPVMGWRAEFPRVASGMTLGSYTGLFLEGPPGGNGTVTNVNALLTAPGAGRVGFNTLTPAAEVDIVDVTPMNGAALSLTSIVPFDVLLEGKTMFTPGPATTTFRVFGDGFVETAGDIFTLGGRRLTTPACLSGDGAGFDGFGNMICVPGGAGNAITVANAGTGLQVQRTGNTVTYSADQSIFDMNYHSRFLDSVHTANFTVEVGKLIANGQGVEIGGNLFGTSLLINNPGAALQAQLMGESYSVLAPNSFRLRPPFAANLTTPRSSPELRLLAHPAGATGFTIETGVSLQAQSRDDFTLNPRAALVISGDTDSTVEFNLSFGPASGTGVTLFTRPIVGGGLLDITNTLGGGPNPPPVVQVFTDGSATFGGAVEATDFKVNGVSIVGGAGGNFFQLGSLGTPINNASFGNQINLGSFTNGGDVLIDPAGGDPSLTFLQAGANKARIRHNVLNDFLTFERFSGGVFVASADLNGNGEFEVYGGAKLNPATGDPMFTFSQAGNDKFRVRHDTIGNFLAFESHFSGGVYTAVADLNADGTMDIVNVNASGNVAAAAANVTGTVTAGAFVGDGSGLTNLPGGSGGDAGTLDGKDSTEFVLKAGDTMSGNSGFPIFRVTQNGIGPAAEFKSTYTDVGVIPVGVSGVALDSSNGIGVAGQGQAAGLDGFGARRGVNGIATDPDSIGVDGMSSGANGIGVRGTVQGVGTAIQGEATNAFEVAGVFSNTDTQGTILKLTNGVTNIVEVKSDGTVTVNGNFSVTGTKNNVVTLADGRRVLLYALESPDNWFEDVGRGELRNGVARITLEATFAQTVNTNLDYHVFLTPRGECRGLYVAKVTSVGFEVRELNGGKSAVAFDYRVMAKRHGYENVRPTEVRQR